MKHLIRILLLVLISLQTFSQTPVLSSYPAAAPVIFLDFDGHTVTGTQWNTNGPIVCGPSNLSSANIQEIYSRMAEDYRPFNLNITTDSTKYLAAPANRRMRVIFTISHTWYPQAVGGVSYINSFTWGDNTPAFVFTAALAYNIKKISEAGSHEAGHTFGLRHQAVYDANCVKLTDYNAGTGSGEIGWAPIMGLGYSQNFTTWNSGTSSIGCTTIQNDLDVITKATNGVTFRTDDYQESFANASSTVFVNNQLNIDGVITTTADKDMFKFTLSKSGIVHLNALPYSINTGNTGSDLDMQVQLFDASQNQVGTYNPAPLLSSVVDTLLNAGTYYLLVDGKGNQFASEYGSLGSYKLQGTYAEAIVLPLHKLELKGVNENGMHKFTWEVIADEAITAQSLEMSVAGTAYRKIADLTGDARSYSWYANENRAVQYRLKISLSSGKVHYSNIVSIRAVDQQQKPQLVANLVASGRLNIAAVEKFNYSITDYNGRTVRTGVIAEGNSAVSVSDLAAGSYLIHFTNSSAQYVEKFVKQ